VVLPTGAGKTLVAEMALEATPRSALIVVPTLDLLQQWYSSLLAAFPDAPIGLLGGGSKEFTPLTLATYDSTAIYAEQLGQSYGTLIFDECHHLPSDFTRAIAEFSIAPYRLGLTATPERGDGRHADLEELIGPTVYRRKPEELAGYALADYQEVRILVQLSESERSRYEVALATRNAFVRNNRRIQWGTLEGWELEATLKPKLDWNKELVEAYYTVCWDGGLKAPKRRDKDEGSEDIAPEDALLERFQKQATEWSVSREVDLLPLGGTVIVPDLKFTHPDGRVVFLEVLRFWEVSYLEKRLTALEREGRTDVLLAVSDRTQLEGKGRLSEAHSSRVLWFKGRLDVKGVLERLSALDKKEKALSRALD